MQRERQADPGVGLRIGGIGDPGAVGLNRGLAAPLEQQAVGLAEREHPAGAQRPVAGRFQVAQVQQPAPQARVDLADVLLRPGPRPARARFTAPVGVRQARHVGRDAAELPGEPVIQGDFRGDLGGLGRDRRPHQLLPLRP